MATKTPRKNAGKRGDAAPKGTARQRPAAARVAPAANEIVQVTQRLDAVRLRAVAARLMASRRKDLEALVAANRKSFEGIQAVVKRQTELLKAQIAEWRSVAKVMAIAGPRPLWLGHGASDGCAVTAPSRRRNGSRAAARIGGRASSRGG